MTVGASIGGVVVALGLAGFVAVSRRKRLAEDANFKVMKDDEMLATISSNPNALAVTNTFGLESVNPAFKGEDLFPTFVPGTMVETRFSFHGELPDELNVSVKTDLTVVGQTGDWLTCSDSQGEVGVIPVAYVKAKN